MPKTSISDRFLATLARKRDLYLVKFERDLRELSHDNDELGFFWITDYEKSRSAAVATKIWGEASEYYETTPEKDLVERDLQLRLLGDINVTHQDLGWMKEALDELKGVAECEQELQVLETVIESSREKSRRNPRRWHVLPLDYKWVDALVRIGSIIAEPVVSVKPGDRADELVASYSVDQRKCQISAVGLRIGLEAMVEIKALPDCHPARGQWSLLRNMKATKEDLPWMKDLLRFLNDNRHGFSPILEMEILAQEIMRIEERLSVEDTASEAEIHSFEGTENKKLVSPTPTLEKVASLQDEQEKHTIESTSAKVRHHYPEARIPELKIFGRNYTNALNEIIEHYRSEYAAPGKMGTLRTVSSEVDKRVDEWLLQSPGQFQRVLDMVHEVSRTGVSKELLLPQIQRPKDMDDWELNYGLLYCMRIHRSMRVDPRISNGFYERGIESFGAAIEHLGRQLLDWYRLKDWVDRHSYVREGLMERVNNERRGEENLRTDKMEAGPVRGLSDKIEGQIDTFVKSRVSTGSQSEQDLELWRLEGIVQYASNAIASIVLRRASTSTAVGDRDNTFDNLLVDGPPTHHEFSDDRTEHTNSDIGSSNEGAPS